MLENDNDPNGRNLQNGSPLMTLAIWAIVIFFVWQVVDLMTHIPLG